MPAPWGSNAHDHDLYAILADMAIEQQDLPALRGFAARLEELAARDGHALYLAIAQRAGGVARRLAGDHGLAAALLNRALTGFQALGTDWQVGRTLFELGELARAGMDTAGARDFFNRALAAFEGLRAAPHAERTRNALQALEAVG
jgi:hypothetical protein